jgi:hypothetical protein
MEAGMVMSVRTVVSVRTTKTRSKIDEYRAGAVRCEQRAKKTRNPADREWQMTLSRAYLMLAEAEAERSVLLGEISPRAAA